MTQNEINRELDAALKELILNGDITEETSREDILGMLTSEVQVTEEQFQKYATYCLQASIENSLRAKNDRIQ